MTNMTGVPFSDLAVCTGLGLLLLALVIALSTLYPPASLAIALSDVGGAAGGFLFCRHVYMKHLEDK
jgi:hypothetical protein